MHTDRRNVRARVRPGRRLALAGSLGAFLGAALVTMSAAPMSAAGHNVSIVDYAFSPSSISVRVGDRVTWTNTGMAPHNVTFGSFGSPYSMSHGARYTHTFTKAGTFVYTCTIHGFSGKVVVLGAPATPRPTPKPTPRPTPKPSPKATPKPTSKPTPAPTARPTPTPAPTSTTAQQTAAPVAVASPSQLAIITPTAAATNPAAPASSSGGDATGPPLIVLVGLLGASVIAAGAVLLRRR